MNMVFNKSHITILLSILFMALAACDHEDSDMIDIERHFTDKWEMVSKDHLIYDISRTPNSNGYFGTITTFYLTDSGDALPDTEYTWYIYNSGAQAPQLELIKKEEISEDDIWTGSYYYTIIKLNNTEMWWQSNALSDKQILKFIRRIDL